MTPPAHRTLLFGLFIMAIPPMLPDARAQQQNSSPITRPAPPCSAAMCSTTPQIKQDYAKEHNCIFPNECETAADLFYEATKQKETSGNNETPSASNNFLPGRNGEPASPGRPIPNTPYYSASYGPTQMTLGILLPAINKLLKENTDCKNTPNCLAPFVRNTKYKTAIQSWDRIAAAVRDTVCSGSCDATKKMATPGTTGPTFPPRDEKLPITDAMWKRITAWNYVADQIHKAHQDESKYTSGYDMGMTLLDKDYEPNGKPNTIAPHVVQMLNYLGMPFDTNKAYPEEPSEEKPKPKYHAYQDTVNNYINHGTLFYNKRTSQYPEAVHSFATGVFFEQTDLSGIRVTFFNDLLGSVFGEVCNKYFSMAIFKTLNKKFGFNGTDKEQNDWVRAVASRWNGSTGKYPADVVKIYNEKKKAYLNANHLTTLPDACYGATPAMTNACPEQAPAPKTH